MKIYNVLAKFLRQISPIILLLLTGIFIENPAIAAPDRGFVTLIVEKGEIVSSPRFAFIRLAENGVSQAKRRPLEIIRPLSQMPEAALEAQKVYYDFTLPVGKWVLLYVDVPRWTTAGRAILSSSPIVTLMETGTLVFEVRANEAHDLGKIKVTMSQTEVALPRDSDLVEKWYEKKTKKAVQFNSSS